jgi:hypothetical protein
MQKIDLMHRAISPIRRDRRSSMASAIFLRHLLSQPTAVVDAR